MYGSARAVFKKQLEDIRSAGTWKEERVIESCQGPEVVVGGRVVLNFCANNYLGLAADVRLRRAAHAGLDQRGFGLASVRFICGTQDLHIQLESRLASFFGFDDAILFGSCFDANAAVFEALLAEDDIVISDELNHASIIDGVRLCRARRARYRHLDMEDLETHLKEAVQARLRVIVTDGVFSMDGDYAPLESICKLAERHDALVMVDDSHASGFVGAHGRGTPERSGVEGRVDILTSTMGKALGGASGGFLASRREVVALLRQRSRPYLFSNALPPAVVAAGIAALDLVADAGALRERVMANARTFRRGMVEAGFELRESDHPIVPVMIGDAAAATQMAAALLEEGIYVTGFSYPVVPKGQARIRVQVSAAHTSSHLESAIDAFARVGRGLGLIRS